MCSFDMSPGGGGRMEGWDIAGADMSPKLSVIVTSRPIHYQDSLYSVLQVQREVRESGHFGGEREGGGLPQAGVQSPGGAHIGGEVEEENGTPDAVEKMNHLEALARR